MSKKLGGIFSAVVLALLACVVVFASPLKANADGGEHTDHCICGGNCETATKANGHTCLATAPVWTAVGTKAEFTAALLSAAPTDWTDIYVYLTADITLSASQTIQNKTRVHLCLNGHTIQGVNSKRVFATSSLGAEFTVCDCKYDHATYTGGEIKAGTVLTNTN